MLCVCYVLIYKSLHHLICIMKSTIHEYLAKAPVQQSTNTCVAVGMQTVSLCQL